MKENLEKKEVPQSEKTLSDDQELNKKIKIISITLIVLAILWIFVINPFITFKMNESAFKKAAESYYDTYTTELPTGERVGEVSLQTIYEKGFLDKDFYVPYKLFSKTTCSVTDSWVKVKKINGDYKYYTYLKCGVLSSNVDHKGPNITLNGEKKMTISLGDKFKDPGIKKITDNKDGDIDIEKATITNKVNPNKIGTYKIKYSVIDSLKNKSVVEREVTVVQKLNSTIKKATDNTGLYKGTDVNNYIRFSGMLYRIVDIDGDNVRIVADTDVANVDHTSIDKWLEYYYDHINENSKKLIVKNKYCKMKLSEKDTNASECSSYTKNVKVYIPSIVDVNKTMDNTGTFMQPATMSWLADYKDNKTSYLTRNVFYYEYENADFMAYEDKYSFGVRPILTIKGDTLIKSGKGTKEKPYDLGDFEVANPDDKVNTRQSGEYIEINGANWRIVDTLDDGTTKVIADFSLVRNNTYVQIANTPSVKTFTYNPKDSENIGYKINNISSEYIETKYFVNHEIEVPIYKDTAKYKGETDVKKYKAKISAPNIHEMFSANNNLAEVKSYWTINSSKNKNRLYAVSDIGVIIPEEYSQYTAYGIRPVAYLNKDCIIVKGKGTESSPYEIDK